MKKLLAVLAVAVAILMTSSLSFAQSCDELIAQLQQRAAQVSDPATRNSLEVVQVLAEQLRTDGEANHCAYVAEIGLGQFK